MAVRRARRRALLFASSSLVLLFALAARVAWAAEAGAEPPFLDATALAPAAVAPLAREQPGVHVAGSGSGMVVCRALGAALFPEGASTRLVVHESIGSTGGVRAVADGVIDIGVVTRPLHAHERALGLVLVPFARVPAVVAAHPGVRDEGLTSDALLAIHRGERDHWADGTPLVLLLRERGDSSHAAFARVLPGFREIDDAAIAQRRARVLYHDEALVRAVLSIQGSVGISDAVLVHAASAPPRVLAIDARLPTEEAVTSGAYPFVKEMAFVLRGDAPPGARALVERTRSAEGAAVLRALGAVPIDSEEAR